MVADGVIKVTTWERAAMPQTRVHLVRDLAATGAAAESLAAAITAAVEPQSWHAAGGTGTVAALPGALVVTHSWLTHEKIDDWLDRQRTALASKKNK